MTHSDLDKRDRLPACSAAAALVAQEPYINQSIAQLVLAMLARLFRHGDLSYHGAFINLVSGRVNPLPVDKAVWARLRAAAKKRRQGTPQRPGTKTGREVWASSSPPRSAD